jgi:hypothetical protein
MSSSKITGASSNRKNNEKKENDIINEAAAFLTAEENKPLVQFGLMTIGGAIALRVILKLLSSFAVLLLPLMYFYLMQTCPKQSSFDGRKELKRVLRGKHLPKDHPEKPKSYLEKMAAKVTASVTTELATLPGYEQKMTSLFNPNPALILTIMTFPTINMQYYWVGVNGQWYFLLSREVKPAGN